MSHMPQFAARPHQEGQGKRHLLIALAAVTAFAGASFGALPGAHASDRTCSLQSLVGPYAVYGQGNVFVGTPQAALEMDVGEITYEKGNFTGLSTFSLNGTIVRTRFSGTYLVNVDCTTTAIVKDDIGETLHQERVVIGSGDQVRSIETEPGAVLARTAVRMN
jgi:hypothetical protein